MSSFEFCVAGQLADSLVDLISNRFGPPSVRHADSGTAVTVGGLDPASERALLTLLWDTGHDVVETRSIR